jgi:hypothetical protein
MITALNLVVPPIGSILLTLFVRTINGRHISEESITVEYTCPYVDGFHKDQAELVYFSPHSDWKLLEYSTESEDMGNGTLFSFNLRIKRRALYYGVMVIAPTVLFALLNPLVFLRGNISQL